jgi:hypothetical protein
VFIPAAVGKITYLSGFTIAAGPVAAAVTGVVTVTGGVAVQQNYQFTETVAGGGLLNMTFNPPIPTASTNQAITVTLPAITGGAVSTVTVTGFQL